MKKIFFLLFTTTVLLSCKNKTNELEHTETTANQEETSVEETKTSLLELGCYVYNQNGNSVTMEITAINDSIKGNLKIAYAEKDANDGTFTGTLKNDKFIGTYTFTSESTVSKREIAFLVKENKLIEGYGEMIDNGTKFKDNNAISYTSTMPLTKSDCKL